MALTTRDSTAPTSLAFAAKAETMVVDDDLRPIPPGTGAVGRLATRGRVPLGYYKDPDRSARTFVEIDGARWSLPGDMATIDADGTVHLLGRGSQCINTGGEKVFPEEVEAVLKLAPGRRRRGRARRARRPLRPAGRRDRRTGTGRRYRRRRAALTLAALQDHCRTHLAGYKLPRALHVVDAVARTDAGKVDYAWARAVLASAPDAEIAERVSASALRSTWLAIGGDEAALARAHVTGSDPVLPSNFRIGAAAAAAIGSSSLAAAELFAARTGREQEMTVDTRHAAVAFRSEQHVRVDGAAPGEIWSPFSRFYRAADGRYVQLHTNFPHHLERALAVLDAPGRRRRDRRGRRRGGDERRARRQPRRSRCVRGDEPHDG